MDPSLKDGEKDLGDGEEVLELEPWEYEPSVVEVEGPSRDTKSDVESVCPES